MTTLEVKVPEPVMEQARAIAEREHIPLEQLITLAGGVIGGVWSHESYEAHRARGAARAAFDAALAEVPDVPPLPGDELP